jgi:hypothetical protein
MCMCVFCRVFANEEYLLLLANAVDSWDKLRQARVCVSVCVYVCVCVVVCLQMKSIYCCWRMPWTAGTSCARCVCV